MTIGGRCKNLRKFLLRKLFVNQYFEPKLAFVGKISSIFLGTYLILTSIVGKDKIELYEKNYQSYSA